MFAMLATHGVAPSFTIYLIEAYGIEKYMQVHFNSHAFENIYGITIFEMIERWEAFLTDLMEEIRQKIEEAAE